MAIIPVFPPWKHPAGESRRACVLRVPFPPLGQMVPELMA